jgi:hypothetical protein
LIKVLINQETAMKIRSQWGIETDSFTGRVVNTELLTRIVMQTNQKGDLKDRNE